MITLGVLEQKSECHVKRQITGKKEKTLDAANGCKTISSMFKSRHSSAVIFETCFSTSFITETEKTVHRNFVKIHMGTPVLESF